MSYFPITIQRQDPATEAWVDILHLHARQVNKASGGEAYSAGREQYRQRLTFDVRWCHEVEDLVDTVTHRVVYRGRTYNLTDYDDYMEEHRMVRLTGELYG